MSGSSTPPPAPPRRSRVWRASISFGLWPVLVIPIVVFALAAMAGLGARSGLIFTLLFTITCGFIGPLYGIGEKRAWGRNAGKIIGLGLGFVFAALAIGVEHWGLVGLWSAGLLYGWFGASSLLAMLGIGPSWRVLTLGLLNAAACATPFWSDGLIDATEGSARATTAAWLIHGNPVLTAAHGIFGEDVFMWKMMYMQQLSRLGDYAQQTGYGEVATTLWVCTAAFGCGMIGVMVGKRATSAR